MKIQVADIMKKVGGDENYEAWKEKIEETLNNTLAPHGLINLVTFFDFNGEHQEIYPERPIDDWGKVIIINNTAFTPERANATVKLNGLTYPEHPMFVNTEDIYHYTVKDDDGKAIAGFHDTSKTLHIFFNIAELTNEQAFENFNYIVEKVYNEHIKKYKNRNSWTNTGEKDRLIKDLEAIANQNSQAEVMELKSRIRDYELELVRLRERITVFSNSLLNERLKLQALENSDNRLENIIKDLDALIQNPKIIDVHIKDSRFEVFTNDIYAVASGSGTRHYIGKFKIIINLANSDVRFHNLNNPRKGYWTEHDDHPHVDGDNHRPCLGNVASTIAELCSQKELMALTMVCISFLENANTNDPAGQHIVKWDRVDEEGNIIEEGLESMEDADDDQPEYCCECCFEYVDETREVLVTGVYEHVDEDGVISIRAEQPEEYQEWCLECIDNASEYIEDLNVHVATDY